MLVYGMSCGAIGCPYREDNIDMIHTHPPPVVVFENAILSLKVILKKSNIFNNWAYNQIILYQCIHYLPLLAQLVRISSPVITINNFFIKSFYYLSIRY